MKKLDFYIIAIRMWLWGGDDWESAKEYAHVIVYGWTGGENDGL